MKTVLTLAILCLVFVAAASAQEPLTVSGGLLNGKAVSLPMPKYPEAQRLARVSGMVAVDIVIDEQGQVISAAAEVNDAHEKRDAAGEKLPGEPVDPALREAAEDAARQATFSPTLLNGKPVRVTGKILYNFVADNSDKPARVGEVYGRLLNREALSMPMPPYPPAARAVRASGSVSVAVSFDAEGNITSAKATSGHPLLRAAAEEAAMKAKIRPPKNGMPDQGILVYKFVP